jgi:COP9 signalosome complex subunit 2
MDEEDYDFEYDDEDEIMDDEDEEGVEIQNKYYDAKG